MRPEHVRLAATRERLLQQRCTHERRLSGNDATYKVHSHAIFQFNIYPRPGTIQ